MKPLPNDLVTAGVAIVAAVCDRRSFTSNPPVNGGHRPPLQPVALSRCRNIFMKYKAFLILALPLLIIGSGCANVKPWQRGTLADYTMRADRDPVGTAQIEHMWFSREEASGGRGVGGGGCGCN